MQITTPCASTSVDSDAGVWFMSLNTGKLTELDPRLLWWLDLHDRNSEKADGFEQSIVRPAIGYQLDEANTAWLGYGWVATSLFDDTYDHEHRIWQQHIWSHSFQKFQFSVRSRLEERFKESDSDIGLRLREFVRLTHPITDDGNLYFVAGNELFINLLDTSWNGNAAIDRNRAFIGLGYKLDLPYKPNLEVGYMNQFINSPNPVDRMTHILQLNLITKF